MRYNFNNIKNFAHNIKPLVMKMQESHGPMTLTAAEMNQIVQYYFDTLDVFGAIESNQDIEEATR